MMPRRLLELIDEGQVVASPTGSDLPEVLQQTASGGVLHGRPLVTTKSTR